VTGACLHNVSQRCGSDPSDKGSPEPLFPGLCVGETCHPCLTSRHPYARSQTTIGRETIGRDTVQEIDQPTLEAIRKLALALSVTSDEIVFDTDERGPDDQLRLQFEALSRLDDREKEIVMEVLDGLLLKHDAKRWVTREKAS
jgi:hypothetical protein